MSAIVDQLISDPGTYFYLNHRGKLAARVPALLEALTPVEIAELKTFVQALTFILREESPTSQEVTRHNGQNPTGVEPPPARTDPSPSTKLATNTPDPAPEPAQGARSIPHPGSPPHPDIWEVVVAPRAGGGPHQIVTRRTRDEVRERARREYGPCFRH